MRPATACTQCRVGKRRCDLTTATGSCSPCTRRNLPCSAGNTNISSDNIEQPSHKFTPPQPHQQLASPASEEEIALVNLYFQYIHNLPHSLFHEATFKQSVVQGTVSKPVLLAMMGMSARLGHLDESHRLCRPLIVGLANMLRVQFRNPT